jgi:ketosteroid isomerase-like protein
MKTPQRKIAESYWVAECARDTEKVLDHYNVDARFVAPGWDLSGHDQIREYYDSSAERFPGLEVDVVGDFASGDIGAVEWEAVLIDQNGVRHPLKGVNVITVKDGKFQEVRAYFDTSKLPTAAGADQ